MKVRLKGKGDARGEGGGWVACGGAGGWGDNTQHRGDWRPGLGCQRNRWVRRVASLDTVDRVAIVSFLGALAPPGLPVRLASLRPQMDANPTTNHSLTHTLQRLDMTTGGDAGRGGGGGGVTA
jgi:hypothetical protein